MVFVPAWSQNPAPDRPVLFDNRDGIATFFGTSPFVTSSTSNPNYAANSQWLKVELHYSVTTKPDQPPFLPSVTFKVWIEGRDLYDPRGKPGVGIAVALTGSVTYINVPAGRDNYGVFYVHPNTLARYSTSAGYTDFDRTFNVHAEAYVGDQLSDYFDKRKEDDLNWFKPLTVIEGLVYRQNQCAFIVDSPDRYPAIKLEDKDSSSSSSAPSLSPPPAPAPTPAPTQ
ncbi:MAG: hypothetical protein LV481_13100 [Methylacidiphilales bacterium]|nr:hypothetical protein [Candidatus Methylacidiphilales bacterium]